MYGQWNPEKSLGGEPLNVKNQCMDYNCIHVTCMQYSAWGCSGQVRRRFTCFGIAMGASVAWSLLYMYMYSFAAGSWRLVMIVMTGSRVLQ